jgi:hypothetical protein
LACEKNSVVGPSEFSYIERNMSRRAVRLFIFTVCLLVGIASSPTPPREVPIGTAAVPVTYSPLEVPAVVPVPPDKPKLTDPSDFRTDFTTDPVVVQSEVVYFPGLGEIIVEAIEQVGHFPKLVFRAKSSKRVLLQSTLTDPDRFLIPQGGYATDPFLRFQVINVPRIRSPFIMAVAVTPGGSDCGFSGAMYGLASGKIARLFDGLLDSTIQGGLYFGKLNAQLGYGFVGWYYDGSEGAHYDQHRYWVTVYQLKGERLIKVHRRLTRHKYVLDNSDKAPLEFGFRVTDQRSQIPKAKEFLD